MSTPQPERDPGAARRHFLEHAPGRLQRVFGIHSGRLVACDRLPEPGVDRATGERWLYRSPAGDWLLVKEEGEHGWRTLAEEDGERLLAELPVRIGVSQPGEAQPG